jgi:predicted hydrolase (HD superfamily)
MLTVQAALELVHRYLGTSPRARHSIFVGFVMHHLAEPLMADGTLWEITGLCHDLDFEATADDPTRHGLLAAQWLAGELPEAALLAIRAHDHRSGIAADTPIAHALKLSDALAVISEALGDRTMAVLDNPDAEALLARQFATRPYLPALLLAHSRRLGITLPALARICALAPPPC